MTRNSRKELVKPFKEPEQAFHSLRKLFKTPSFDHLNPSGFKLFSDHKDQSEEEIVKTMGEPTMQDGSENKDANEHIKRVLETVNLFTTPDVTQDQLMLRVFPVILTGTISRWLRNELAGSINTWEILKGKFLSQYCPPTHTAKKMEEINNFQQEPNETLYQAWKRFKELLLRCPQHYLMNMQDVILFYKGLDVPTRQILDSNGVVPKISVVDAKKAIQEMADHSQKWHNRASNRNRSNNTSNGLAVIQAQLNNLGREIKKVNENVYAALVGSDWVMDLITLKIVH
ncbi:hypothetical protein Tco_1280653 [Tanacetum coccineum]